MPFISEGQTLFLVLLVLYLSECVIWLKRQSVAFISGLGGSGRVTYPHQWLGNASGGILFLNPLPPAGKVFVSHLLPISISPSGICAFNVQTLPSGGRAPAQTGRTLLFSEIKHANSDGAYLLVNKEKFAKCATSEQARKLATLIAEMAKASTSKRESLARSWITKQFQVEEARERLRDGKKTIKLIKSVSSAFSFYLFVLVPIWVSTVGLLEPLLAIAILMVIAAVRIGTLFYKAHKKLYPEDKSERIEGLVKMILCPPAAARAADLLTRNMLADYSPIVLADLLTGNRERRFVRAFIRDLQYPLKHEILDETAKGIINWSAAEQLNLSLEYVKSGRFGKVTELLAHAERAGNSISYCPRCACQFVVHSVDCPDCPGVELIAFSAIATSRNELATDFH